MKNKTQMDMKEHSEQEFEEIFDALEDTEKLIVHKDNPPVGYCKVLLRPKNPHQSRVVNEQIVNIKKLYWDGEKYMYYDSYYKYLKPYTDNDVIGWLSY